MHVYKGYIREVSLANLCPDEDYIVQSSRNIGTKINFVLADYRRTTTLSESSTENVFVGYM